MCDRPVIEVCPVEWGRMAERSVLQWDKDDCAAAGLVKFDLLGLGMLSVLHYATDLIAEHHGVEVDLATLPGSRLRHAAEGRLDRVFQIESRAQMATFPGSNPARSTTSSRGGLDPGPIQGGQYPYIRRRNGLEPVTYLHPLLENALAKTLGVPLFQEQLMQIAIDVANSPRPTPTCCVRQWFRRRERMDDFKACSSTGCGPTASRTTSASRSG